MVHLQNWLFIFYTETNKNLTESFTQLKHCGNHHNYHARAKPNDWLIFPISIPIHIEHTLLNITA